MRVCTYACVCVCGSSTSYACAYFTAGEERLYLPDCWRGCGKRVDMFITPEDLQQAYSLEQ